MYFRKSYIEHLFLHKDKDYIKVVTGIRRSGKSTILQQYQQELLLKGVLSENIIYLNFDSLEYEDYLNYHNLYTHLTERIDEDMTTYLFLDEIQMVDNFEKVLASLQQKRNIDIYITGSNAYLLSSELATLLSGRYVEILVFPFSFYEYYDYISGDKKSVFREYMRKGGFPYAVTIQETRTYNDYIQGILNTVLIKDVMNRNKITDSMLLESIAKFLFSNVGSLITVKKISDSLVSANRKTSAPTVERYLSALLEALVAYKVDRYNIVGRKLLQLNSKYYLADLSLKNAFLGKKRPDFGHDLENIVYVELIRRGYKVYVGDTSGGEVDFVAMKEGITEYFQVSLTVRDENVYQREVSSIKAIKDNYRKLLLTEDDEFFNDEGIEHYNIIDWLLDTAH